MGELFRHGTWLLRDRPPFPDNDKYLSMQPIYFCHLPSWCHFGLRQCRDQGSAYLVGIKFLDGLWGPVHVPDDRFGVSLAVASLLVVIDQPALG